MHEVAHAIVELRYQSIRKQSKYKLKLLEGKRKAKEFGGRPANELRDVHVGSIQAGRKNEYAESLGSV